MMEIFDLIVLGGGPAGYNAAERAGAYEDAASLSVKEVPLLPANSTLLTDRQSIATTVKKQTNNFFIFLPPVCSFSYF